MSIQKMRKRDDRFVDFEVNRIKDAIHRAFIAVELEDGEKAESVTREVVKILEKRFIERIPSVEDTQDIVVEVLKKRYLLRNEKGRIIETRVRACCIRSLSQFPDRSGS